ncbi:MAG: sulfotransferase [Rhodanobacteraceae bacterium]
MNVVENPAGRTIARQWERAQRYITDRQFGAARAVLEALLTHAPENVQARLLLASVCLEQQHLREACAHLGVAAKVLPNDPEEIFTVAYCLHQVGETVAMRDCLRHPEIARTRSGHALARIAHMHQVLGQHRQALALMDRAKACGYDTPEFRYFRSLQLQFNGRIDEAVAELEACLRAGPTIGRASVALARMRKQTPESNHLDYIAAQLQKVQQGSEDHASFEFARFKELDDLDRREEAWVALQRGNAIMYARVAHDLERERRHFAAITGICSEAFVNGPNATFGGPVPIFIVGMPRSGTTLLERIVSNHSQVSSYGELSDFMRQMRWVADVHGSALVDDDLLARAADLDYTEVGRRYLEQTRWRANGKPFYVDKLPHNFLLAGFIRRALPQARILHMVRSPMDVCFSNWKAMFGEAYGYSYKLEALADYYRLYRGLMAHWRRVMPGGLLEVPYAELVRDPEAMTRRVLAFCGLPDEPGCSDIAANRNPVSTLSTAQVREPIHRRAITAWRRYAEGMRPLREALGELAQG